MSGSSPNMSLLAPGAVTALSTRFAATADPRTVFVDDSAALDDAARANLKAQAGWLAANPSVKVALIAGAGTGDRDLAADRAQAVARVLIDHGIARSRLRLAIAAEVATDGEKSMSSVVLTEVLAPRVPGSNPLAALFPAPRPPSLATPVVDAGTPGGETPAGETPDGPGDEPEDETPVVETPSTDAPQDNTPPGREPQPQTPVVETPSTGAPQDETPKDQTPKDERSDTPAPDSETPDNETPDSETPDNETPGNETPGNETPKVDEPREETPGTETPVEETPGTDTPRTDKTDKTKGNEKEKRPNAGGGNGGEGGDPGNSEDHNKAGDD